MRRGGPLGKRRTSRYPEGVTLLLLLACSGPTEDTAAVPSIRITSPADGSTVCNSPLVIVTEVLNFELVPVGDTAELPGTGHIDLAINGQEAPETMYGEETMTVPEVASGYEYQLKVELSNADHTPIEPYAGDFVYVFADAGACGG